MSARPFAHLWPWVVRRIEAGDRVIGLYGSQGAGKSTVTAAMVTALAARNVRAVALSLDDFYLTRAERAERARRVHPEFATRGVPGTHDVALGQRTLRALREASVGDVVDVPRFDKAVDDRRPAPERVIGPVDVVLFEGWCVGVPPLPAERLVQPFNAFERDHDPDGRFRRAVADALAGPYQGLWAGLEALVALVAPGLDTVVAWRTQAEQTRHDGSVASSREARANPDGARVVPATLTDIGGFVQRFARWSAWGDASVPARADRTLWLDEHRGVVRVA